MSNLTSIPSIITSLTQCTTAICPISLAPLPYVPSLPINAVLTSIFCALLITQFIFLFMYRTWSYSFAICIGLLLQIFGYSARLELHYNVFEVDYYIGYDIPLIQVALLNLAPFFLTGTLYIISFHLLIAFKPAILKIPPKFLLLVFVSLDAVSMTLQWTGYGFLNTAKTSLPINSSSSTSSSTDIQIGNKILISGLVLQVFSLLAFMILSGVLTVFIRRELKKEELMRWVCRRVARGDERIKKWFMGFVFSLITSTILLFTRALFRLLSQAYEHKSKSPITRHETLFLVFEGATLVLFGLMGCLWHPGRWIDKEAWKWSCFGGRTDRTERERESYILPVEKPVYKRIWPL